VFFTLFISLLFVGFFEMSSGITFEIRVLKNSTNYLTLSDPNRIEEISQNLEKDRVWGWCVPEVKAVFDKYTAVAQLAYGSYTSEEDFESSAEYEYLKETAINSIFMEMDVARRLFEREVEKYYQGRSETLI